MPGSLHDIMLRANTALFAQNISRTILDLTGEIFEISASTLQKGVYQSAGSLAAIMHFVGNVQGDFIITTEESTANTLLCPASKSNQLSLNYEDFIEQISELINVAVGSTVPELEKRLGLLTLTPPTIVNGKIRFPSVACGNVDIQGKCGMIRCTLSINMAQMRNMNAD